MARATSKVQLCTAAATQEISEVRPGEGGEQGGARQEERGERGVHHGGKSDPVAPQPASSHRREHRRGREVLDVQPTQESRDEPVDAPGSRARVRASSPQPARQCEDCHPTEEIRVELRRAKDDRAACQHAEGGKRRVGGVEGGTGPAVDRHAEDRRQQQGERDSRPGDAGQSERNRQQDAESRHVLRSPGGHQGVGLQWSRVDLPGDSVVPVVVADIEIEVAQDAGRDDQVVRLVAVDRQTAGRRQDGHGHHECDYQYVLPLHGWPFYRRFADVAVRPVLAMRRRGAANIGRPARRTGSQDRVCEVLHEILPRSWIWMRP